MSDESMETINTDIKRYTFVLIRLVAGFAVLTHTSFLTVISAGLFKLGGYRIRQGNDHLVAWIQFAAIFTALLFSLSSFIYILLDQSFTGECLPVSVILTIFFALNKLSIFSFLIRKSWAATSASVYKPGMLPYYFLAIVMLGYCASYSLVLADLSYYDDPETKLCLIRVPRARVGINTTVELLLSLTCIIIFARPLILVSRDIANSENFKVSRSPSIAGKEMQSPSESRKSSIIPFSSIAGAFRKSTVSEASANQGSDTSKALYYVLYRNFISCMLCVTSTIVSNAIVIRGSKIRTYNRTMIGVTLLFIDGIVNIASIRFCTPTLLESASSRNKSPNSGAISSHRNSSHKPKNAEIQQTPPLANFA